MDKILYSDLHLDVNTDVNTFIFNGKEIAVKKYLPASDKFDLIMITIQESVEDGIYNEFKLDLFLHLNLVYLYTNIEFTDDDKVDPLRLYDELESSGFMSAFLAEFNEGEYAEIFDMISVIKNAYVEEHNSVTALARTFITDMPANAEIMKSIVDTFDPQKYTEVVNFAKAANAGRPV